MENKENIDETNNIEKNLTLKCFEFFENIGLVILEKLHLKKLTTIKLTTKETTNKLLQKLNSTPIKDSITLYGQLFKELLEGSGIKCEVYY